jgi:hypothetical protein
LPPAGVAVTTGSASASGQCVTVASTLSAVTGRGEWGYDTRTQ